MQSEKQHGGCSCAPDGSYKHNCSSLIGAAELSDFGFTLISLFFFLTINNERLIKPLADIL